jgi:ligand-binding SRPBCC domain-containing protein
MKTFDVQSIAIRAPFESVFAFIAKAENLPRWTSAFKHVNGDKALMESPAGVAEVKLSVKFSREAGTVDWYMSFQDGSAAKAYSRVVNNAPIRVFTASY